jgi:hypothetical protein
VGIDLVARHKGKYIAVQCKYKKQETAKLKIVTWKALSTFYALCMRTGPWEKFVVMTNCAYVRHMGKKTPKDLSICLRKLQGVSKEDWLKMCGVTGHVLAGAGAADAVAAPLPPKKMSEEEVRIARLKFLGKV